MGEDQQWTVKSADAVQKRQGQFSCAVLKILLETSNWRAFQFYSIDKLKLKEWKFVFLLPISANFDNVVIGTLMRGFIIPWIHILKIKLIS